MIRKLTLVVLSMLMVCASYAQIYKWTDSQDVMHFSDSPHTGAKQVTVSEAQSYTAPVIPASEETKKGTSEEKYTRIAIIRPLNEATIRNNQGYVAVAVELNPALAEGDMLQMIFDGAPMGDPQSSTIFQLNGIYRGAHTLAVQVLSTAGDVLLTSNSITVFMHRPRVGMSKGASN